MCIEGVGLPHVGASPPRSNAVMPLASRADELDVNRIHGLTLEPVDST
jgi:hypothetical protein